MTNAHGVNCGPLNLFELGRQVSTQCFYVILFACRSKSLPPAERTKFPLFVRADWKSNVNSSAQLLANFEFSASFPMITLIGASNDNAYLVLFNQRPNLIAIG
jgi:hypothetical protein